MVTFMDVLAVAEHRNCCRSVVGYTSRRCRSRNSPAAVNLPEPFTTNVPDPLIIAFELARVATDNSTRPESMKMSFTYVEVSGIKILQDLETSDTLINLQPPLSVDVTSMVIKPATLLPDK